MTACQLDVLLAREHESHRLVEGIKEQEEGIVLHRLAVHVAHVHGVAADHHAEAERKAGVPVFLGHLGAIDVEPHDILHAGAADAPALEKFRPAEDRVLAPELDQPRGKLAQLLLPLRELPVEPGDLVILAVGIVIAVLRAAKLIAAE